MNKNEKWLEWAVELQSLAQAGLYYGKDIFDIPKMFEDWGIYLAEQRAD